MPKFDCWTSEPLNGAAHKIHTAKKLAERQRKETEQREKRKRPLISHLRRLPYAEQPKFDGWTGEPLNKAACKIRAAQIMEKQQSHSSIEFR